MCVCQTAILCHVAPSCNESRNENWKPNKKICGLVLISIFKKKSFQTNESLGCFFKLVPRLPFKILSCFIVSKQLDTAKMEGGPDRGGESV